MKASLLAGCPTVKLPNTGASPKRALVKTNVKSQVLNELLALHHQAPSEAKPRVVSPHTEMSGAHTFLDHRLATSGSIVAVPPGKLAQRAQRHQLAKANK